MGDGSLGWPILLPPFPTHKSRNIKSCLPWEQQEGAQGKCSGWICCSASPVTQSDRPAVPRTMWAQDLGSGPPSRRIIIPRSTPGETAALFSDLQLVQLLLLSPSQCEMGNTCSSVVSSRRELWQEAAEAGNVCGWRAREGARGAAEGLVPLLGAAAAADRWWWNSTPAQPSSSSSLSYCFSLSSQPCRTSALRSVQR